MQRLVAALLAATVYAGKVTVQYRNELVYSGVTPKLHLQGSGFGGDGTNIELIFVPKLAREKYSVLVTSDTALSVLLKGSATWPLSAGQSESSLYLTGYRDDTQGFENLLEEPIMAATVLSTPTVVKHEDRLLYMSASLKLLINGTAFRAKQTQLTFDPPLYKDVDYTLQIKSPRVAQLSLKTGRKWRSDGNPGPLKLKRIDTGAGPAPTVSKEMPRILGKIAEDAMHASGAQITPTASTQTLYETPALRHLKMSGSSLCAKKYSGTDALVEFVPAIPASVFRVTKATPNEIQLVLNNKQKWPVGVLYVGHITCGDKSRRKFAGGQGVGVATVLADPVVDAHPELKLYGTHSKRLVVRGSGFSPDGTSLTLEPTRAAKYSVIEATGWSVTLELKPEGVWVEALGDKSVELKVTKIDSGAGEVIFDKPIIVATVKKEPEGDICDDSCEWALDGICDDGTTPNEHDDGYGQWDDDYGEYGDDNNYYAGFYDDSYGALFDDEGSLPACAYGTDCTDCQPLHGDATKKEQASVECDNTCAYARDGFCDDPRQGGECALGTDCQDCGPASKANYTNYEDDTWWDDDEQNWYWDDDYFADGDDERRHFEDVEDATKKAEKDDDAVGYVKSADPFATEPDENTGAAATLLVTALLVTGALLGCCAIFRVARGDKCVMGKGDRKEDLAQAWSEMTERSDKKKADVPLTPDVSFTGAMV